MKNNKKIVLGSVVALALSVGVWVLAPNLSKADNEVKEDNKAQVIAQAEEALKKAQPVKAVINKVNNVNTGVAGLTGVVATLATSALALFKSKRK